MYANGLPRYIQHGSGIALFTDDSKLFRPTDCKFRRLTVGGPGLFTLLKKEKYANFRNGFEEFFHAL